MNTYEKILLTSLGLLRVSAKEAKKAFKVIKDKKPSEKELEIFFAGLIKEGQVTQKESEKKIKGIVKMVLKELVIPARSKLRVPKKKTYRRAKK